MEAILYIYMKEGEIRVLSHVEALNRVKRHLKDGWKHVATIDAADFIEVLCAKHSDKEFREKFIQYLIK